MSEVPVPLALRCSARASCAKRAHQSSLQRAPTQPAEDLLEVGPFIRGLPSCSPVIQLPPSAPMLCANFIKTSSSVAFATPQSRIRNRC